MKTVILTGASSGIGAATVPVLVEQGYRVVMVARSGKKLAALANAIGPAAVVVACDAGDGDAVLEMAARIQHDYGAPGVIINSAGAGQWKWIEETTPAEAEAMMRAPYHAAFNMTHAFMPGMLKERRGLIVHVNSPVALMPWPGATGYAATRWALRGLHESLDVGLKGTGIRSCHVVFGHVESPYFDHNPGALARMPRISKTIRTLTPEECATILADVLKRPRREVIHPFMLRLYAWNHVLFPWSTRWLVRRTGARR